MTEHEKRRHQRARAQGLAAYLWIGGRMTSAILENISAGGLFFRSPRPVALGTPVTMRLVKPGMKKPIELSGFVVNGVSPKIALARGIAPGMGVQFNPIPSEQADRFFHLLDSLGLPPPTPEQLAPVELPPEALEEVLPVEPVPPVLPGAPEIEVVGTPLPEQSARAAPPPAAPGRPAPSGSSYAVHDAALRVPRPSQGPVAVARVGVQPPPSPPTDPVSFELEVPTTSPGIEHSADRAALMGHVTGLLNQLADANETLRQRDEEIARLRYELGRAHERIAELAQRLERLRS